MTAIPAMERSGYGMEIVLMMEIVVAVRAATDAIVKTITRIVAIVKNV